MTGAELKSARTSTNWTQRDASILLGVTQAYLSMVERGLRPVSDILSKRALEVFPLPATKIPLSHYERRDFDGLDYKQLLGSLGYPGFAYLNGRERLNPAQVLMNALDTDDLDSRVAEALPWVLVTYPGMDWNWLIGNCKGHDRQNRLAFVVGIAGALADKRGDGTTSTQLQEQLQRLERSRLAAEDTLCRESMTQAERVWLRTNRPEAARHWNLLTDLSPEHLGYA